MDFFKKVSLKDIIGDEDFFRPKKMDIMKDENIIFHLNNDNSINQFKEENLLADDNEIDFEK